MRRAQRNDTPRRFAIQRLRRSLRSVNTYRHDDLCQIATPSLYSVVPAQCLPRLVFVPAVPSLRRIWRGRFSNLSGLNIPSPIHSRAQLKTISPGFSLTERSPQPEYDMVRAMARQRPIHAARLSWSQTLLVTETVRRLFLPDTAFNIVPRQFSTDVLDTLAVIPALLRLDPCCPRPPFFTG